MGCLPFRTPAVFRRPILCSPRPLPNASWNALSCERLVSEATEQGQFEAERCSVLNGPQPLMALPLVNRSSVAPGQGIAFAWHGSSVARSF